MGQRMFYRFSLMDFMLGEKADVLSAGVDGFYVGRKWMFYRLGLMTI
jgi:hypothetical protein